MLWITYVNFGLTGMLFLFIVYKGYQIKNLEKKELIAVMLSKDRTTKDYKTINPNNRTFDWNKGTYNISKDDWVEYKKKKFLFYMADNPTPINVYDPKDPRMEPETWRSILQNAVIRALNQTKGEGILSGLSLKQWILIGIALVAVYMIATGGIT